VEDRIAEMEDKFKETEGALTAARGAFNAISATVSKSAHDASEKIGAAKSDVQKLSASHGLLVGKLEAMDEAHAALSSKMKGLEAEAAVLIARFKQLETQVETKAGDTIELLNSLGTELLKPQIEILDPPLVDGVAVVNSERTSQPIIMRVGGNEPVKKVTLNGTELEVGETGLVQGLVDLTNDSTAVEIVLTTASNEPQIASPKTQMDAIMSGRKAKSEI